MKIRELEISDKDYPAALREIYDPPKTLYVCGNVHMFDKPLCAIVGTRRMSGYGENQARRFAKELSQHGIGIVSGLAFGIDKAAHEGALESDGGTIAVVAQGLEELQPVRHRALAEKIVAQGGIVISERAGGEEYFPSDYLVRNRIIAGMSGATLVIEAPFKSGAMNTAKLTLDNNRELMALPGRVSDETSQGTNALLQRGARLVTCPKEVAEFFKVDFGVQTVKLDGFTKLVYEELQRAPRSPAELGELFQNSLVELYEALGELELRGLIRFSRDLRYGVSSGIGGDSSIC